MKMKSTLFLLLITLSFVSCEVDNYDAPYLTLSGKIVDSQTGELVESGGVNAGTVLKLYEGSSNQPLLFNTLPDGTFTNSKVFAGNYSYLVEGPFVMAKEGLQSLAIEKNEEVEIKVIPNVKLALNLEESSGNTAKVSLKFDKIATDQQLVHLAVVWSKFKNPNNFTFPGGSIIQEDVEALDLTSGEKEFIIEDLEPNTKYYIRGSARTANPGNYYNYSTQIELQTK